MLKVKDQAGRECMIDTASVMGITDDGPRTIVVTLAGSYVADVPMEDMVRMMQAARAETVPNSLMTDLTAAYKAVFGSEPHIQGPSDTGEFVIDHVVSIRPDEVPTMTLSGSRLVPGFRTGVWAVQSNYPDGPDDCDLAFEDVWKTERDAIVAALSHVTMLRTQAYFDKLAPF